MESMVSTPLPSPILTDPFPSCSPNSSLTFSSLSFSSNRGHGNVSSSNSTWSSGAFCSLNQGILGFNLPGIYGRNRQIPRKFKRLGGFRGFEISCQCQRAGDGVGDGDEKGKQKESDEKGGLWDMESNRKRMQAAMAKLGDPLVDMMASASKKLLDYLANYQNEKAQMHADQDIPSGTLTVMEEKECVQSEWERWEQVFLETEEQENLLFVLKSQLEDAVQNEDFQEASRLKCAISAIMENDAVFEVMDELKRALEEERYSDAAMLRDEGAAGLVGWWVGVTDGGEDPFGRIISIRPAQGRLIAKGYTARQLVTAGTGTPLFEVFVTKDKDGGYQKQAVYLQRERKSEGDPPESAISVGISDGNICDDSMENSSVIDDDKDTLKDEKVEDSPNNKKDTVAVDEGINRILSFLKDKMPDLKLKVFQVTVPGKLEADLPKILENSKEKQTNENEVKKHLQQDGEGNESSKIRGSARSEENDVEDGGQSVQDKETLGGNTASADELIETSVQLVLGRLLQNISDDKEPAVLTRVPAKIEYKDRGQFTFHIDDTDREPPPSTDPASWKIATLPAQTANDLVPGSTPKVLSNGLSVKVSKEMADIIKLAVNYVQKRRGLSKCTSFYRIDVAGASTDPLNGLYIGALGPYSSEVIQLRRRYGNWEEQKLAIDRERLEFFEYVEAVKITGDLNARAGQVAFRAKIGKQNRLPHRGIYPEELGVVARYKGQGRMAEPGGRNPNWIDGELVLFNGKGMGPVNGAELGFVYTVSEKHILVLFHRLKLQP